ncbi:MAG: carboxypeptidase-like regulatory domain-containing protein, partial [Muribaculaceae bacterium]|nr:carboxypeptidase-like regulatory domain-containing protein [Muribaculaceae bacterium]
MRKLFLILMTLIACSWTAMAQTRTYHGTVVDAANNEPLVGATVMPIGGGHGVATDIDGKFTLTVPSGVKEVQVSYVGYQTSKLPLTDNMVASLTSSSQTLDDVMVVAFGTTTKEAFTGSAAVVDSKDLQKHTTTNVADALVGSVPGLQMRSTTG